MNSKNVLTYADKRGKIESFFGKRIRNSWKMTREHTFMKKGGFNEKIEFRRNYNSVRSG